MRLILGIALLLAGLVSLSCRLEGLAVAPPTPAAAAQWVRTVDGWERSDRWYADRRTPPRLHPLVVATGQVLLSVLALVACQREPK